MNVIPPELVVGDGTGRKSGRIEVLVRADRRRSWTAEQKHEIVAESLGSDVTPAEIARKHGITTGQLYTWRRQMVSRRSGAPVQPGFAPVELEVSALMSPTTMPG